MPVAEHGAPIADLFAEAERQLNVCNACRYCEGYCAVWPQLELHTLLSQADVTHLANLCHDCRDCFSACMYVAPHEFDLNPPRVFTQVREFTYRHYIWPGRHPRRGFGAVAVAYVLTVAVTALLSYVTRTGLPPAGAPAGSPYRVLPYPVLLVLAGLPVLGSAVVLAAAAARYWRDTHGSWRGLVHPRAWLASLIQGLQLHQMRGGGQGCDVAAGRPTRWRRRFHLALAYGLLLCLVATISAAVMQDLMGIAPPYGFLSVPVLSGTIGGVGMIAGSVGLLYLRRDDDPALGTPTMRRADLGLLWALIVLAGTGIAVLLSRSGPAFGTLLILHVAAVIVAFAVAPYTKFVHALFRMLALYRANLSDG